MIIDDVIWEVINNSHCSYKVKTETNTFCRNQFNLTGLCNRNSCPLANSKYATIREEKGVCYLYMKTAERAHTPNELWEKITLDKSYRKALEQIDENLEYWPEFIKHKAKQRFTKIRQMLIKKKRMKIEGSEQYEVISRKAEKREKSRLVKAEKSALIDKHIEEELLKNLQTGKYKHIWNVSQKNFENVLDKAEVEVENEEEFDSEEIDNVFVSDLYKEGDLTDNDEEDLGGDFDDGQDEGDKTLKKFDEDNENFHADKHSTKSSNDKSNDMINKKRKRPMGKVGPKKGKFNVEYEYDQNKEEQYNYNNDDW